MKLSKPAIILIISFLFIFIPFAILDYAHFPYSDGPEHGAAVRALAKNLIQPDDPMLTVRGVGSPRYVPSILGMALVMRLLQADVINILKLFLIVYFALFQAGGSLRPELLRCPVSHR